MPLYLLIQQFIRIYYVIGVNPRWLNQVLGTQGSIGVKNKTVLIDKLLQIINLSSQLSKNNF